LRGKKKTLTVKPGRVHLPKLTAGTREARGGVKAEYFWSRGGNVFCEYVGSFHMKQSVEKFGI